MSGDWWPLFCDNLPCDTLHIAGGNKFQGIWFHYQMSTTQMIPFSKVAPCIRETSIHAHTGGTLDRENMEGVPAAKHFFSSKISKMADVIKFIRTSRGGGKAILNGVLYTKHRKGPDGRTQWYCMRGQICDFAILTQI